jgi:hypothetical protein
VQLLVLEAFEEWVADFEPHAAGRRRSSSKLIRDWAGEGAAAANLVQVEAGLAAVGLAPRAARALFECALGPSVALARMRDSYRQASPQLIDGQQPAVESELEWLLDGAEVDSEEVAAALADRCETPPNPLYATNRRDKFQMARVHQYYSRFQRLFSQNIYFC